MFQKNFQSFNYFYLYTFLKFGNFFTLTSLTYFLIHFSISKLKFLYCFTNLGEMALSPKISSVTRICPSQNFDEPIPIVGINIFLVIFGDTTHSK